MIIPTFRCRDLARSVSFYTATLDFEFALVTPNYAVLTRDGDELHLELDPNPPRQIAAVLIADPDATYATFRARGLPPSDKPDSPVHHGPLDQSWGTREFYVDDPDGNTLRFVRR